MPDYVRATEAFAYGNEVVGAGQIWPTDHPAYKGREQFFEPVATAAGRAVETATASPGESRTRSTRLGSSKSKQVHSHTPSAVKPEAPGTPAEKE